MAIRFLSAILFTFDAGATVMPRSIIPAMPCGRPPHCQTRHAWIAGSGGRSKLSATGKASRLPAHRGGPMTRPHRVGDNGLVRQYLPTTAAGHQVLGHVRARGRCRFPEDAALPHGGHGGRTLGDGNPVGNVCDPLRKSRRFRAEGRWPYTVPRPPRVTPERLPPRPVGCVPSRRAITSAMVAWRRSAFTRCSTVNVSGSRAANRSTALAKSAIAAPAHRAATRGTVVDPGRAERPRGGVLAAEGAREGGGRHQRAVEEAPELALRPPVRVLGVDVPERFERPERRTAPDRPRPSAWPRRTCSPRPRNPRDGPAPWPAGPPPAWRRPRGAPASSRTRTPPARAGHPPPPPARRRGGVRLAQLVPSAARAWSQARCVARPSASTGRRCGRMRRNCGSIAAARAAMNASSARRGAGCAGSPQSRWSSRRSMSAASGSSGGSGFRPRTGRRAAGPEGDAPLERGDVEGVEARHLVRDDRRAGVATCAFVGHLAPSAAAAFTALRTSSVPSASSSGRRWRAMAPVPKSWLLSSVPSGRRSSRR